MMVSGASVLALILLVGMAVPDLRAGASAMVDIGYVALALTLSGYCFAKRRARSGLGLRFMGAAFLIASVAPAVGWAIDIGSLSESIHVAYLVGSTVLMTLGIAIVALRGLQLQAQESEERLRWTEERFELALRGASDGVWDWDLTSDTIVLTPRLREICRVETDRLEFASSEMTQYIHEDDTDSYLCAIQDVLMGRSDTLQIEFRLKPSGREDEAKIWCLNRGLAIRGGDNRVLRMAGTITDITERKRFERQLIDAKEEAELASRSKSEFLAHMSHELRTPLNAIIGFTDMMKQEVYGPIENPRYREYADTVNMAGRHLLQIIGDIIDLSKVESGQTKLEDTLFDPRELLESCQTLVAPRAAVEGLHMSADIPDRLPWLRGDAIRVKQIVLNLLTNATKFTPEGGRITLRAYLDGDGLSIAVEDTGIGIARRDIPTALSRFGRLGSPYVRSRDGMGLGLTLVQMFADLHDARFTLDSEEGVGTTATVTFPLARIVAREGTDAWARSDDRAAE